MSEEPHLQPFGRVCHICGGTEFRMGYMDHVAGQGMFFYESDEPPRAFQGITLGKKIEFKPIRARYCVKCTNVQYFAVMMQKPKRKQKPKA